MPSPAKTAGTPLLLDALATALLKVNVVLKS